MTTHNQEILNKLKRRIIKLDHGRVVSDGVGINIDEEELKEDNSRPEVVSSGASSKRRMV
jgi:ABC-type phosphate/phosphonate transport system ATPase subunit